VATLKDVAERANVSVPEAYHVLTGSSQIDAQVREAVIQAAEALDYRLNITIKDVAAYAGVSVSTVSYVINNNPLTKSATRQRVRNAIRDLGYHPNTTARNLKSNQSRMIGYAWHVSEDTQRRNLLLDQFLYELAQHSEANDYHVLTCVQPTQRGLKSYETLINTNRVDGFVLSDLAYDDPRVQRLMELKIPFAAYGHSSEEWDFPYVDVDGQRGIQLAVEHLLTRGHERIGLISWPEGFRIGDARTAGYYKAMQSAGLPIQESWVAHTPNTFDHSFDATHQILSSKPRPTAIVCANDIMAFGARRYLESMGLEAGTDVALVGYDDTPVAELLGLTSVRQPIAVIASKVVELLLAEIAHQRPVEHQIMLEPSLVVRSSSVGSRRR
jgi:DNA-binding LacI/PurR family transcriptional regulator